MKLTMKVLADRLAELEATVKTLQGSNGTIRRDNGGNRTNGANGRKVQWARWCSKCRTKVVIPATMAEIKLMKEEPFVCGAC